MKLRYEHEELLAEADNLRTLRSELEVELDAYKTDIERIDKEARTSLAEKEEESKRL
jgi:hypothetical protein